MLCHDCPLRSLAFCSAAVADLSREDGFVRPRQITARPRQTIYRKHQKLDDVILIREGWAVRFTVGTNNRRQILSILLPGDVISTAAIFKNTLSSSVQTTTAVSYCAFDRAELLRFIEKRPGSMKSITSLCVEDRERCDQQLIALVTRSAEERIAFLMLDLCERMTARGLAHDHEIPFPLTQQHLAEAVGLTQVHVNRVLRRLREEDLVEISGGMMRIKNPAAMKSIAQPR